MGSMGVLFEGINFLRLLGGLMVTLQIAIAAIIIGTLGGILFGLIMTSHSRVIRILSRIYLEVMRIIPILVWLFIVYYGMAAVLNIHIDGMVASIVIFSMWGIAEMGDIVRGAITTIPIHQTESAYAIGLSKIQLYRYILIPQAVRRMLPGTINLATRMVKTTSLVVLIGVIDVVKVGQQIIEVSLLKNPAASFWVYGCIFFLYFIICYPLSLLAKGLESKWQG